MMTPEEALAIYQAGPETVVRVLLGMDVRLHVSEKRVHHLEERLAKDSHKTVASRRPPTV